MTDLSVERELNQALGDFAERRGKIFFERIKAREGSTLRQRGCFIAIDAMTGEFVFGEKIGSAMDAFRQAFGDRAVAWLVDLDEPRNGA